ncbi:ChrR family anti-sigma-E factor [Roseivivax sp. CAU 1761]
MIRHHPTEDILMAYSRGDLPEAMDLVVATHLSLCDACRATAETFDAIGGTLLEATELAEVSDACLSATMACIRAAPPAEEVPPRDPEGVLPPPLAAQVGGGLDAVRWRGAGMGVKQAILRTHGDAVARLLSIPPGVAMPDHGHRGIELTLVLQGAFRDDHGRFARGDMEIADAAMDHIPVAETAETCICLAVTDAPLRFRGWLPRLAQPFLKI